MEDVRKNLIKPLKVQTFVKNGVLTGSKEGPGHNLLLWKSKKNPACAFRAPGLLLAASVLTVGEA